MRFAFVIASIAALRVSVTAECNTGVTYTISFFTRTRSQSPSLGLLLVELGRRRRSVALGTVGGAVTGATIVSVASVLGLLLVEGVATGVFTGVTRITGLVATIITAASDTLVASVLGLLLVELRTGIVAGGTT